MSYNLHLERFNHIKPGGIFKECSSYWMLVSRRKTNGVIGLSVKCLGEKNMSLIRLKAIFYRAKYRKYFKDALA